jgi:hypothetical protein
LFNENNHETSSRDMSNYVTAEKKILCQLGALVSKCVLCNAAFYCDLEVSPYSKALPERPSILTQ